MQTWIREWVAPAVLVAVLGISVVHVDTRFDGVDRRITDVDAKLDRRLDAVTTRFDAILQQQATMAAQLGALQSELAYVKTRLDKVADKLQVTSLSPRDIPGSEPTANSGDAYTGSKSTNDTVAPAKAPKDQGRSSVPAIQR